MLKVKALACSLGILSGAGMFLLGILNLLFGYGDSLQAVLASAYIGFEPTFVGAVVGAIWGFVDGFICGGIIAWLYNQCKCRFCKEKTGPAVE